MAHITLNPTIRPASFAVSLMAPLRAIGRFFIASMENNSRCHLVEQLNAKSDAELAEMGLKREDIVRYVFRDYLYL